MISSGWAQLMFKLIRKSSAGAMSIELCIFDARVKQGSSGAPCLSSERHISWFIDTSTGRLPLGAMGWARGGAILRCQIEMLVIAIYQKCSHSPLTWQLGQDSFRFMRNERQIFVSFSILQFNVCSATRSLLATNEETSSVGLYTFHVPAIICASPLMPGGIWN